MAAITQIVRLPQSWIAVLELGMIATHNLRDALL